MVFNTGRGWYRNKCKCKCTFICGRGRIPWNSTQWERPRVPSLWQWAAPVPRFWILNVLPLKSTRALWRNGWFRDRTKESTDEFGISYIRRQGSAQGMMGAHQRHIETILKGLLLAKLETISKSKYIMNTMKHNHLQKIGNLESLQI